MTGRYMAKQEFEPKREQKQDLTYIIKSLVTIPYIPLPG